MAKGYEFVTPDFVRTGVGNFFGNIADALIAVNNLLQGKGIEAASGVDVAGAIIEFLEKRARRGRTRDRVGG